MAVTYRTARTNDIRAVSDVYWTSVLDVYRRYGFEDRRLSYPVNPFYGFCLREEPEGFFVAEEEGKVIGAAFSWVRGHVWFLSHLFILPSHQGKGIGRTLFELSLQYGITAGAAIRAVITMAFNPSSVALYMKSGMTPLQDIYLMKATRKPSSGKDRTLACVGLESDEWEDGALNAIDLDVLGIPRPLHHCFFFGQKDASCRIFRLGGRTDAYAYLWKDGRIGPAAVLEDACHEAILDTVITLAWKECDSLALMVPGANTAAMKTVLAQGFTVAMPYVMLSSLPFGAWDRYLFHSPGLM